MMQKKNKKKQQIDEMLIWLIWCKKVFLKIVSERESERALRNGRDEKQKDGNVAEKETKIVQMFEEPTNI